MSLKKLILKFNNQTDNSNTIDANHENITLLKKGKIGILYNFENLELLTIILKSAFPDCKLIIHGIGMYYSAVVPESNCWDNFKKPIEYISINKFFDKIYSDAFTYITKNGISVELTDDDIETISQFKK